MIKKIIKIPGAIILISAFLFLFLFFFSSRFNLYVHAEGNYLIDRAYEYRAVFVRDEAPGAGPGNRVTQPKNSDEFSFAIMGDTQSFNSPGSVGEYRKAVTEIQKKNPDLVMTVGDLIQSCKDNVACDAYRMWKDIDKPLLPITFEVMGNHDHKGGDFSDSQWQNYFNLPTNGPPGYEKLTYSFDFGNSHFVVLDSEHPYHEVDATQQKWLDDDLTKNTKPNVFVFFHEPAFPMSYKIKQSLDARAPLRDSLWSILDRHNVTAVFNGHEHIFSIRKIDSSIFPQAKNSIYQFIVGHTDAPVKPNIQVSGLVEYYYKDSNYAIVKVNGNSIILEDYATSNDQLVKSFTFSK
jgi:hypothetical protein